MKGYPSKETVPTRFGSHRIRHVFHDTSVCHHPHRLPHILTLSWNNVRTHVDWAEVIIPPMLLAAGVGARETATIAIEVRTRHTP